MTGGEPRDRAHVGTSAADIRLRFVERDARDVSLPVPLDTEIAHEFDPRDQSQDIPGGRRLRRLQQPRHRTHGDIGLLFEQRAERHELRLGQSIRKRPIRDRLRSRPCLAHQHFEHAWDRQEDTLRRISSKSISTSLSGFWMVWAIGISQAT